MCIVHTSQLQSDQTLKTKHQELDCDSGILGYRTMNFNVIPETLFQLNKEIKAVDIGDKPPVL